MKRVTLPLAIFAALVVVLALGLQGRPKELPSPLIGRPAPTFSANTLETPARVQGSDALRGQVWVLNVWASWCSACRLEHPLLVEAARREGLPLYGLNYKDAPADAARWLAQWGDPYRLSFSDRDGRVGLEFGVYGAPETFIIDRAGIVRFKHVGALDAQVLREQVLPLVRRLQAQAVPVPVPVAMATASAPASPAIGITTSPDPSGASADPALEARVMAIAEELRCLVCQNETLAASQAELARDLRAQIRGQLQAGRTAQDVTDFMVERYGDFVRYRPPLQASTAFLWGGPFLLLALAAVWGLRRIRARSPASARPLNPDEQRRVAQLLGETPSRPGA